MKTLLMVALLLCSCMAFGQSKWAVRSFQDGQVVFVQSGTEYVGNCMYTSVVASKPYTGGEVRADDMGNGITVYTTRFNGDCSGALSLVGKQFPDCKEDNWKADKDGKACVGLLNGKVEHPVVFFHNTDKRRNIIVSLYFQLAD